MADDPRRCTKRHEREIISCLFVYLQGHVKVGSARGCAPRNPSFLAVAVRQSRTAKARANIFGEAGCPHPAGTRRLPEPHQKNFDMALVYLCGFATTPATCGTLSVVFKI